VGNRFTHAFDWEKYVAAMVGTFSIQRNRGGNLVEQGEEERIIRTGADRRTGLKLGNRFMGREVYFGDLSCDLPEEFPLHEKGKFYQRISHSANS